MHEHQRKRFIMHLFKTVGDRAGPDRSEWPHNKGEPLCQHALEPVGFILRTIFSNAYENIKEKK